MKKNSALTKHFLAEKVQAHCQKHTLIVAHRGVKSLAPMENTLESFRIAIDLGIPMVEFDVRRTKDSVYVIHHNDAIDGIKINTLTYQELSAISFGKDFQIPRLLDALILCKGKIRLDIELKEHGYEQEVLDLILTYFSTDEFIIVSFHDNVIQRIKQINPSVCAGLLLGVDHGNLFTRLGELFPLRRLKKIKADFVAPHYILVTRLLIYICNKHGYGIYVWTVNKNKIYRRLMRKRVTAIVTDYPQRFPL